LHLSQEQQNWDKAMHLRTILISAAALYSVAMTQLIGAELLTINVTNLSTTEGTIMIQIMQGEAQFNGEESAIASVMQSAASGDMSFTTQLPAGEYAIRVMHDVNNNGSLDSNFVGMPIEPWAMSNNAKGNFGPPKWEQAKFELSGPASQTLNLAK
jgi:uncharacterized protein (DUF2141 family)